MVKEDLGAVQALFQGLQQSGFRVRTSAKGAAQG
jgi:hypothetical protein